MHFAIEKIGNVEVERRVLYRSKEYSFEVEPSPLSATSVLVNDLHLYIDLDGTVVGIGGLCPHTSWEPKALNPLFAERGQARLVDTTPIFPGVSLRLNKGDEYPVFVDWCTGWVQVSAGRARAAAVKFFKTIIFEVDKDGQFSALWLKPDALPQQTKRADRQSST